MTQGQVLTRLSTHTEKVDSLSWKSLTTFTEKVDSFPKNVDFVRILFTLHLFLLTLYWIG